MAKNNRRFGPADRAVAITALLNGATVAAAATAAGFAAQTLYDDRKRCPLFARYAPPVSGRPGRWRRWRPG
jgi:transposase-like protein